MFQFISKNPVILKKKLFSPVQGPTAFTNASSTKKAKFWSESSNVCSHTYPSIQQRKLYAILLALQNFSTPVNIVNNSQYVVTAVQCLKKVHLSPFSPDSLTQLFIQIQQQLLQHSYPVF